MFVRKAVLEFLELWSEARSLSGDEAEGSWWVLDWRWLTSRDEDEPAFISECVLID